MKKQPHRQKQSGGTLGLAMDLAWLDQVISHRFDPNSAQLPLPAPPAFQDRSDDPYAEMVHALRLEPAERLVLILALTPHLAPERLDPFLLKNEATGRCFSEFGGMAGQSHTGFLPTAETALFLLAGRDLAQRLIERPRLLAGSALHRNGLIELDLRHPEEPPLSAMLRPGPAWLERLLSGSEADPPPGPGFPAVRVTTTLDWADLVLDDITMEQVELIRTWISHADTLLSDPELARRLKPGYRCLFHGPPGTGKTLTASLLGKAHGLPVYRVDLSRVVSKWIGDTEKNLAALFDHAQHRNWILFFDEAESLFGQRTESRSANDRSANQQISYLLQRLEDYPGLTILATNSRSYMDEAFTRRFQSTIRFPFPGPAARRRLWEESFRSPRFILDRDVDFTALAEKYELAGGSIINVLRHVCLLAVRRTPPIIHAKDLAQGIREEMQKEGRFSK